MSEASAQFSGHCQCGRARFSIAGRPLLRAYCHCLICQEFNQADFADITVFYRKDVSLEREESVLFRVYKQPPLVRRGKCRTCGMPAIERLNIPLMPRMAIVPSRNIEDARLLPEPSLHIFYHRRKADAQDDLPKYSGFLNSQSRFSIALAGAMLRGTRRNP